MLSRFLFSFRIPALVLSAVLQLTPMVRQALPAFPTSGNLMAIIFRWGVGAAATLGSVQAVSGASTVITTPLNQTVTNGVALGNNQIRLITAPDQAHYWEATGLPPGLYLSGIIGQTSWKILGTPTALGTYNVSLVAKDQQSSTAERTATATMVITVVTGGLGGGNSPPVANAQSVSTAEDTAKGITLSGSDPDADPLTYSIVSQPSHGTLTGTAPTVTYTPAANYNGPDSFTFRVNDGTTNSPLATVSVIVTAVNDAPAANAQSITTPEDTGKSITLSGSDVENSPLTYAVVGQPSHGTLTGTAPNLTYTPTANYNGPDNFTFRVNDGNLNSPTATVSITVDAVNDAPVAHAQSTGTPENTAKAIILTGSDIEGSTLTFSIVSPPAHGSLSGTAPAVTYTPAAGYSGTDSFTFKVNDGSLDSPAATVSLAVSSVNSPPVANAQSVATPEDTAKAITLSGTDPNGDPLTYTVLTQPTKGVLSGTGPDLSYAPNANVNGPDSFTFRVNDGTTNSLPATISITIAPVNDPPVANAQSVSTAEDTAKAITLSGSDIEGSSLAYAIVAQPSHGTVSGSPPNISYAPAANYNGPDSFTFKVNDGGLDSPAASVSLTVTPVNDPPVAANLNSSASSGNQVTLNPLSTSSDPDGDSLSILSVSPTNGTATVSGGTTIQFIAPSNFVGTAFVGYTLSDGQGGTASGLITIAVTAAPVTQFSVQAGSKTINSQTGLYEQPVTVNNTGNGTAAALRLKVDGLRPGVTLYNASGQDAGVPYVQYNAPLNPGESVVLHLEFYVPDRQPFTNTFSVEATLPQSSGASSTAGLAIDRSFLDRTNPSDPRFAIEFATLPGGVYTVIYTDDMVNWKAATPSLTASATRTQWYDDGPPKTDSKPAGGRFYRVIAQ